MARKGFEHLITGRTAKLPGDLKRHAPVEPCPNGTIRVVIPGPTPGKPRMTQRDRWKKRPAVVRYRDWCDRVRGIIVNAVTLPDPSTVMELNWVAYFEPPTSWAKKRRALAVGELHRQRPDRDNIDKAILDCLWPSSDSAIAAGRIEKRWDWNSRLEIEIVIDRAQLKE